MQLTHVKLLTIFRPQFFMKWHFHYICLHYSIILCEICGPAKVKKQPFRGVPLQMLFKAFAKNFNNFSLYFPNLGVAAFREHIQYSFFVFFLFTLLAVFTNRILEHFIILSLHSVVLFYVYVYDGWAGSMSLICEPL